MKTKKLTYCNILYLFFAFVICLSIMTVVCSCSLNDAKQSNKTTQDINVACLKGPTAIGVTFMLDSYDFSFSTSADAFVADIASGDTDIALLPANVASTIYDKGASIKMIDINTQGVLYGLSQDTNINEVKDLEGKTIYLTGKGSIPEKQFISILAENNMTEDDLKVVFCSEASEVITHISKENNSVGIINEPQASIALNKNNKLHRVLDLTNDTITGVTVVNTNFLESHKEDVDSFIKAHETSVAKVKDNPEEAAKILIENNVFEQNESLASAIENCNICCIYGNEMIELIDKFFERINQPKPDNDFYYLN